MTKDGVVTFPLPNRTATGFTFTVILTEAKNPSVTAQGILMEASTTRQHSLFGEEAGSAG
jgi:hypothetical protein